MSRSGELWDAIIECFCSNDDREQVESELRRLGLDPGGRAFAVDLLKPKPGVVIGRGEGRVHGANLSAKRRAG